MFNNDETNILYLKIKSFWSCFNRNAVLNNLNEIAKTSLNSNNEKLFSDLNKFLKNIEDPSRIFVAFEQFFQQFKELKLNEIRYKNELKELKNLKDELLADLQRTNKTVSSYQYIQISTLNEIEELKKSLQDAQVSLIQSKKDSLSLLSNTNVEINLNSITKEKKVSRNNSSLVVPSTGQTSSSSTSINFESRKRKKRKLNDHITQLTSSESPLIDYDISQVPTSTLDTESLVLSVKRALINANLSQVLFAKALFNDLTINVFSPSLKPFENSSLKLKNVYCKMYMWLNDPDGVVKLKDYQQNHYNLNLYKRTKPTKDKLKINNINDNDCILISDD